ncbi:MAG: A/G-specific adenine glycosylase [Acidobacteria bacterium]|nr:A/G-specific adenine glycosylase [Acidobacteriota bacterium]
MSPNDLLTWYDACSRDLPWRKNQDPYGVWVSEIMLQQTRVETVIPYYQRFLERFPDVRTLAEAPIDDVLSLWSGLGYYRRARQLHRAAEMVLESGGLFPQTAEGLLELPGIGPYTAAAVASIAFDEVVPVMDGNVERVLSRVLALSEDPRRSTVRRTLLEAAKGLLDQERPGDSNQALMELGATVCTPRNPRCSVCPIAGQCRAHEMGREESFPVAKVRRTPERHRRRVAVVAEGERILLFRRGEDSELLAGTWELPWATADGRSVEESEVELAQRYGGLWRLEPQEARVRHSITFRNLELDVHRATVKSEGVVADGPEAGWFSREEISSLPTSSQVTKVLAVAGPGMPEQQSLWS